MRNAWPFLLLMAACATTSVYERGTMRPAPAPVRPGVGAPTVGQPGFSPDALPRGPYTRVLPPTREPGIWAANPPKAVSEPVILNVVVPMPPGDQDLASAASACAAFLGAAAHEIGAEATALRWPAALRTCLVARLLAMCAEKVAEDDENSRRAAVFVDAARFERVKRLRAWARDWQSSVCTDADLAATDPMFDALEERWDENHKP